MSVQNFIAAFQRGGKACLLFGVVALLSGCTFYVGGKDAGTRDGEALVVPVAVTEVC